jgi:quinol monooxygenase YgiN
MRHKTAFLFVCALLACSALAQNARTDTTGGAVPPLVDASEPRSTSEMGPPINILTLTAAAAASSQASAAAGGNDIFHVAIFRFGKEHVDAAMAAFRALATASRRESGNLSYNIYRGTDDEQEFYVVEHWVSPAALAAHERTEAFIRFGRELLMRQATLHEAVTGRPFDVN